MQKEATKGECEATLHTVRCVQSRTTAKTNDQIKCFVHEEWKRMANKEDEQRSHRAKTKL